MSLQEKLGIGKGTQIQTQRPMQNAQMDYDADPFDRIGNAQPSDRSSYPLPGLYPLLYCEALKMKKGKNPGDVFFIADFSIVESNVPGRPKGSSMAWICNLRHLPSPGNIRSFLAALNSVPIEEVDSESARCCCAADNPCRGRMVRLEATETTTKSGQPFTACKWTAVSEQLQGEKAEQLRQAAGFAPF
jgi:hypothetical protein